MSLKKIQIACELLTEQMNHWTLFPIALTMMEMTRGQTGMEKPDMLLWILCSLFPLLFFVLRMYHGKKKRYQFLLWHIAAAAAFTLILLIPPRPFISRAVCILCGAGYLIHSLILRLKKDTLYTVPIQLPACVALAIVSTLMRHTNQWNQYYIFSLIAVIAMFSLVFYIRQYLDYMSLNMNSTGHLPAGAIFRSGTGLVAAYTLIGTVILIISVHYEWLARVLGPVSDFLVQFLRFLLSKIFKKGEMPAEEETILDDSGMNIGNPQLPELNETFWLWQVLEIVFTVLLIAGLAFIVLKLFLKLIGMLQEYLNRRLGAKYAETEEMFDIREKCDTEETAKRKKPSLAMVFTNRERIRRLYKKKLLLSAPQALEQRGRDRSRLGLFTAREWEGRLRTRGMADIYERARYSEQEVTSEDVKRMKEACSGKGRERAVQPEKTGRDTHLPEETTKKVPRKGKDC